MQLRLRHINPEFWADDPTRHGQGLAFDCPHCIEQGVQFRIVVCFSRPLDGSSPSKFAKVLYGRRGDTFDTLTITLSNGGRASTIYAPEHARITIDQGEVSWSPMNSEGEAK